MLVASQSKHTIRIIASLVIAITPGVIQGQLSGDPAALPWPAAAESDSNRAVVISVTFNSPTEVVSDGVIVSNTRAKASIGAPPLILLELLNGNGITLAQQHSWHPLWVRDLNEGDGEFMPGADSGPGTFYVPFDEDLRSVRILDMEMDVELITVDVSGPVEAFCTQSPTPALCSMFKSSFE